MVASTTFGIYLLHDNKLFLHYMWDNVLATYQYYDSIVLPLYAIFVVALIFVVGMTVDYVRLAFIEKPVMKAITPSLDRIQSRVGKYYHYNAIIGVFGINISILTIKREVIIMRKFLYMLAVLLVLIGISTNDVEARQDVYATTYLGNSWYVDQDSVKRVGRYT